MGIPRYCADILMVDAQAVKKKGEKIKIMTIIKKILQWLATALAVLAVAVFVTAWVGLIPSFGAKASVLDTILFWGLRVRTVITFLAVLLLAVLSKRVVAKHRFPLLLAAVLPLLAWGAHAIFGNAEMAVRYPMYGVMLSLVPAMTVEAIVLEVIGKSFSVKDVIEDFLFSIALATVFYGFTVVAGVEAFSSTFYAILPTVAFGQLVLAGSFHSSSKEEEENEA